MLTKVELICADELATSRLGETLALALKLGDLVTLSGELGAGKTVLARSLIRCASNNDALEVASPTFTLVQSYEGMPFGALAHADLYRLGDPSEIDELGFEEALDRGVLLIEWPERAGVGLPEPAFSISLELNDDESRSVGIEGREGAMLRLRRSLAIRAFLNENGHALSHRRHLIGDASARAYETIRSADNPSIILMNAPARSGDPPVQDGKSYGAIAHLAEDVAAFVAIDQLLVERGFRAPAILAADLDEGFLLLEDLGTGTIITSERQPISDRYKAAIETLAAMHQQGWPDTVTLADGREHRIPPFDEQAMMIEVDLLAKWYAPYQLKRKLTDAEGSDFTEIWRSLIGAVSGAESSLVLRDYHSPNIIWCDEAEGNERIGLIDFQDALIGPSAYDVAALAQDARIAVPEALERELVEHYCTMRGELDRDAFDSAYAIMAAQRATKILGIFVRLSQRDGKHQYLAHLPHMEAYLHHSLAHPALANYRQWVNTVLQQ